MPPYCAAEHGSSITVLGYNFVVVIAAAAATDDDVDGVIITFCAPRSNSSWLQLCRGMSARRVNQGLRLEPNLSSS
jgi:hypothetical protein